MEYFIFVQIKHIQYQLQASKRIYAEMYVIECKNKHEI